VTSAQQLDDDHVKTTVAPPGRGLTRTLAFRAMSTRHSNLTIAAIALLAVACGSGAGRIDSACSSNGECAETERCAKGSCGVSLGICVERPTSCDTRSQLVCGCDSKTYLNRCLAEQAGVLIAETGGCPCDAELPCMEGEYCSASDSCGGVGFCAIPPESCEGEEVEPVCGCNGETYENECTAEQAGVRVSAEAPCDCETNDDCSPDDFCNAETCDGPGACEVRPTVCEPGTGRAVTGCDDLRYENRCFANQAGQRVRPDS
jgi:hypothetical protein